MSVTKLNAQSFDQEVLHSNKPVLVDFYADWCGPCKMMGPIIDQMANEMTDVKVCKINSDEEPELATQFNILSIPTVIAFKDGKAVNQSVGVAPKDRLVALLG